MAVKGILAGTAAQRTAYSTALLSQNQWWAQISTDNVPVLEGYYQWNGTSWALNNGGFVDTAAAFNVNENGIDLTERVSGTGDEIRWFSTGGVGQARLYKNFGNGVTIQVMPSEGVGIYDTVAAGSSHADADIRSYVLFWPAGPGIEFYNAAGVFVGRAGRSTVAGANMFFQNYESGGDVVLEYVGNAIGSEARVYNDTLAKNVLFISHDGGVGLADGITAPGTQLGLAFLYVDVADGDLKIKFGDGTVKTIVIDT